MSKTGISIIINPALGLPILQRLFGSEKASQPHGVWFQPGAADEHVRAYVKDNGLEGRVVVDGCVLVSGDKAREEAGVDSGGRGEGGGGTSRL